ncbi:MAG: SDR family oxidoreductase [Hyphomicrobiaceae bacterium]
MTHLLAVGLGYTARVVAESVRTDGWSVTGSARSTEKIEALKTAGFGMLAFDPASGVVPEALPEGTTHLLVSASPDDDGDPVLNTLDDALVTLPGLEWVGYLSTIGVYGNYDGAWIDETAERNSTSVRARRRVVAEDAWQAFGARTGVAVQVFRLPGIYGPGRNPLERVLAGKSRRIVKPGQVFNRAHVDDIAQTVVASMRKPRAGAVYNIADDEPAPPQDVIAFSAELLGMEPPPEENFDDADMTEMARQFYGDNKRISNALIKSELGVVLKYPTYREGLRQLREAIDRGLRPDMNQP